MCPVLMITIFWPCFLAFFPLFATAHAAHGSRHNHSNPEFNRNFTFSVSTLQHKNTTRNHRATIIKAYARYGFNVPALRRELAKRGMTTGSVINQPTYGDSEYVCYVNIGGMEMRMTIDTGSADTWVFSSYLPNYAGHNYYIPSNSTAFQSVSGASWKVTYADDSYASGVVGTDTVTIGSLSVRNQAVELATQVSSEYILDTKTDGLLGLGFNTINTVRPTKQRTLFDNALPQLEEKLFTAYLRPGEPGSYNFGYINSTQYTAPIHYVPVYSTGGFWKVNSNWYKIKKGKFYEPDTFGIIDTGTTLMLMSDLAVKRYYAVIQGSYYDEDNYGYVFPCNVTLPLIKVKLGTGSEGYYASVAGDLLNWGKIDGSGVMCFGALQSRGSGSLNIYGDIFLKANFVVFDRTLTSGPRLGVASHA